MLLIERFALTQMLASCSVVIGFTNSACVLNDPDASDNMKSFAYAGFFVDGCKTVPTGIDFNDGLCYHTSVNLTFVS